MNTSGIRLGKLYASFVYGFRGLKALLRERNYRIAVVITVVGAVLFWFVDRQFLWIFIPMATIVLISEGTNTAIEVLCDFVHEEKHPVIGKVKDMAAANTVVAVLLASAIGLLEFIKLWGGIKGTFIWAFSILLIFVVFSFGR